MLSVASFLIQDRDGDGYMAILVMSICRYNYTIIRKKTDNRKPGSSLDQPPSTSANAALQMLLAARCPPDHNSASDAPPPAAYKSTLGPRPRYLTSSPHPTPGAHPAPPQSHHPRRHLRRPHPRPSPRPRQHWPLRPPHRQPAQSRPGRALLLQRRRLRS